MLAAAAGASVVAGGAPAAAAGTVLGKVVNWAEVREAARRGSRKDVKDMVTSGANAQTKSWTKDRR